MTTMSTLAGRSWRLLTIAQPFKAGLNDRHKVRVPTGTKETRFCRPSPDWNGRSIVSTPLKRWAILILLSHASVSYAQNFHEIAPPVDYSFVPTWAIFLASFIGLCLIGLIV